LLHTETATHPSTNRAQCLLTTLIEANALTTTLRRHLKQLLVIFDYTSRGTKPVK